MKRFLTLVGSILGIAYSAFSAALTLIFFLALWAFLNGVGAIVTVIGVVTVAAGITALVLNAVAARCFSCSVEKYAKRRKLIIAAVVFNLVPSSFLLFVVIIGMTEFFMILPALILGIVSAALLITDLCLEKVRIAKAAVDTPPTEPPLAATPSEQAQ